MRILPKFAAINLLFICFLIFSACGKLEENTVQGAPPEPHPKQDTAPEEESPVEKQTSAFPNLQAELLTNENTLTTSAIGQIDFKNHTYPFPRGWQDVDSREFTLEDGKRPISKERIGITYITTKYGDATGDGEDEALVVLKIDTGGGGIPQIVYVYSLKKEEGPELIWHFRTGDRSDGGLKKLIAENGEISVELFGQDRYILGEVETMRIDGDEEQLCCPTHFTRTHYKWNGSNFVLKGKRETFSMKDEDAPPVENMINKPEKEKGGTKK
ncbi:MAG: hypothetical protein R2747_14975 [Pyrinomonadaceae bacterium]